MKTTKVNKKKTKFNLDGDDSDEDVFAGLTHGGKRLEDIDDFKDEIPMSSEDEHEKNKDKKKGKLDENMVARMNFGGGELEAENPEKKSRKEIFDEIIAKSKSYKMVKSEIKHAAEELQQKLDDDY